MNVKNFTSRIQSQFDSRPSPGERPPDRPRIHSIQHTGTASSTSSTAPQHRNSSEQDLISLEDAEDVAQVPTTSSESPARPPTAPPRESGNGIDQGKVRNPPPVPRKPKALESKIEESPEPANQVRHRITALNRSQTSNVPPVKLYSPHRILLIDNEVNEDASESAFELNTGNSRLEQVENEEVHDRPALPKRPKSDPAQQFFKQISTTATQGFNNVKKTADKAAVAARPAVARVGSSFDQMGKGVKETADKAAVAARPAVARVGSSFDQMGKGVKEMLDKTGATGAFDKTADDINDASAKLKGKEGLCSKCKKLPLDKYVSNEAINTPGTEVEWATPLSRIIYHGTWCRVCRLLLMMLCAPWNDPLKHSAVSPYVQPELAGLGMHDWINKGWAYTDEHWPFGHGAQRHEGASYVLGPSGYILKGVATRAIELGARMAAARAMNRKSDMNKVTRDTRHAQELRQARKPPQYPLSCVITINHDADRPGMLNVVLLGYGRKVGAEVQGLSTFRLRATSSFSTSTELIPLSPSRSSISRPFSYGKRLDPQWIDPATSGLWLRECEAAHGLECNEHGWAIAMQKPGFLRVVDVEDFCVKEIEKPAECRFIALSYVWGGAGSVKLQYANMSTMMRSQGLLEFMADLPQTIVDAIEVVKGMGERYLWTDALCILQENTDEAKEQMNNMDRVFGSAVATIVAAQGEAADAGLGGIQQSHVPSRPNNPARPRSLVQIAADVKDSISLIAPLWTTDHSVDQSSWNGRAWTFQERVLSRRLIIFSHGQMIWHCRRMICREDMTVADSGVYYKPLQWLSLKPKHLGLDTGGNDNWRDGSIEITRYGSTQLVRSATFAEFARSIEEYTHRHMSFESDILNAFAGLSHIYALCFGGSRMLAGLPESHLDVALLWRPCQRLKRREGGFPSWSWCGWKGQAAYPPSYKIEREQVSGRFRSFQYDPCGEEGIRPMIRWHLVQQDPMGRVEVDTLNNHQHIKGLGFPYEPPNLPREWENGPYSFNDRGEGRPRPAPSINTLSITKQIQSSSLFSSDTTNAPQYLLFHASHTSSLRLGVEILQKSDFKWTTSPSSALISSSSSTKHPLLSLTNSSSDDGSVPLAPLRHTLLDAYNDVVGNVLLDGDGPADLDLGGAGRGKYGFIQIAEATYFGLDDEVRDVEGCVVYVVMFVKWVGGGGSGGWVGGQETRTGDIKVARRLGIGRVRKTAWMLAEPRVEMVCLG